MPQRYRDRVYFQVTNVTQEISNQSWTTRIETVMRIRIDKKDAKLYLKPRAILLSRNWFEDMGMPEGIGRYLTNFEPLLGGTNNFIPVLARGAPGVGHAHKGTNLAGSVYDSTIYLNTISNQHLSQYNHLPLFLSPDITHSHRRQYTLHFLIFSPFLF